MSGDVIYAFPGAAVVLLVYLGALAYKAWRRGIPVGLGDFIELYMAIMPFLLLGVLVVLVILRGLGA